MIMDGDPDSDSRAFDLKFVPLRNVSDELHDEFRSPSTVLVLATAFNHKGQPTSKSLLSKEVSDVLVPRMVGGDCLCVRDSEVVAVTARDPSLTADSSGPPMLLYCIMKLTQASLRILHYCKQARSQRTRSLLISLRWRVLLAYYLRQGPLD